MDLISPTPYADGEIDTVVNDINTYLDENYSDLEFRVDADQLDYGFSTLTAAAGMGGNASATINFDVNGEEKSSGIFYLYTTPPYYTEEQLLAGSLSGSPTQDETTGESIGQIMLSPKIAEEMGLENIEDALGKIVTVKVSYSINNVPINIDEKCEITGIVDVNMFATSLVMYVDYDYLASLVSKQGGTLAPTSFYIHTDSESTTDIINNYLSTTEGYTGSVENQMASMFSEMMSTFSIALAIIDGISLIVAMIMI